MVVAAGALAATSAAAVAAANRPHLRTELDADGADVAPFALDLDLATAAEMTAEPVGTLNVRTGLTGERLVAAAAAEAEGAAAAAAEAAVPAMVDVPTARGDVFLASAARRVRASGLTLRSCMVRLNGSAGEYAKRPER